MPRYSSDMNWRANGRSTHADRHGTTNSKNSRSSAPDTSKPTAVYKPKKGRKYTLSVAIPGSIIANAQTTDLKSLLAGQIARALAVFCVDEVIVFNDGQSPLDRTFYGDDDETPEKRYSGFTDPCRFLAHILSYLETPPHLRKLLFPLHPDLRTAGTLPSLDMPHHFRANEWCKWREGVIVSGSETNPNDYGESGGNGFGGKSSGSKGNGANGVKVGEKRKASGQITKASAEEPGFSKLADVGLPNTVKLSSPAPVGSRVTVRFESHDAPKNLHRSQIEGEPVVPSQPREEAGYYWGFGVRSASSVSAVFTESPFPGGYDVSVGTSERGVSLDQLQDKEPGVAKALERFEHLVVFFGGLAGLEKAIEADEMLSEQGVDVAEASKVFDAWVDVCPGQGSRTIRTEEAVWIGLAGLRKWVVERDRRA